MKRKLVTSLGVLFISIGIITVSANDQDNTLTNKPSIFFNGVEKTLPEDYEIINVNGHLYAPIRYITENTGSIVHYKADSQKVTISNTYSRIPTLSTLFDKKQDGPFILDIHSEKSSYNHDEPLNIYSTLTYTGIDVAQINFGLPIMSYYIKRSDGMYYEEGRIDIGNTTQISSNNEFFYKFPLEITSWFNLKESGLKNIEEYQQQYPNGDILKPGKYTIGIIARFEYLGEKKEIESKLPININ